MRFGLLALISLAVPATAGDFSLISPIDCALDGPCYIQQYVDHDAGEGASDFTCSSLSYDGHKGTDFALPSHAMIAQGVDVLASASGTVVGVRDGMADVMFTRDAAAELTGRECGNGVVLRHADGWETQYCHLRRGSVRVARGAQVAAGEVLGQVGMSGRAEFPHLHLSVRRDGAVVDPFDPDGNITCGTVEQNTLWSDLPPYLPGGIVRIGTSGAVPEFNEVRAGTVAAAQADSDALVIYAFLFGTRQGDVIRLSLSGPNGVVISRDTLLKRTQAQSFRAIGKKRRGDAWTSGSYNGFAELLRGGDVIARRTLALTLP